MASPVAEKGVTNRCGRVCESLFAALTDFDYLIFEDDAAEKFVHFIWTIMAVERGGKLRCGHRFFFILFFFFLQNKAFS